MARALALLSLKREQDQAEDTCKAFCRTYPTPQAALEKENPPGSATLNTTGDPCLKLASVIAVDLIYFYKDTETFKRSSLKFSVILGSISIACVGRVKQ